MQSNQILSEINQCLSIGQRLQPFQCEVRKTMKTNTIIIVGVVVAAVVLAVTCVGGIFALMLYIVNNVPEGIVLDFDYPNDVVVGEEFDVTITIENVLDESRILMGIDFYGQIFDGVSVLSFDPSPTRDDGDAIFGSRTVLFNRLIPAEGEIVIVVTMTAQEAGSYTGDVDITIDNVLSLYSTSQTIVINEP